MRHKLGFVVLSAFVIACAAQVAAGIQSADSRSSDGVCIVDFVVSAPLLTPTRTTCGAGNDSSLRPSEDHQYEITIPTFGEWTISVCDATFDTYLYLGTGPCGSDVAENDDDCDVQSQIVMPLDSGVYYVTIEGFGVTSCGEYQLLVVQQCNDCGDGVCCSDSETACNCPQDCPPTCGDSCCTHDETCSSCAGDCACDPCAECLDGDCVPEPCGNGICRRDCNEGSGNCCVDCAVCGDQVCDSDCGESACNCPTDCDGICPCTSDTQCDDGLFCNGAESCVDTVCISGDAPCPACCDEAADACPCATVRFDPPFSIIRGGDQVIIKAYLQTDDGSISDITSINLVMGVDGGPDIAFTFDPEFQQQFDSSQINSPGPGSFESDVRILADTPDAAVTLPQFLGKATLDIPDIEQGSFTVQVIGLLTSPLGSEREVFGSAEFYTCPTALQSAPRCDGVLARTAKNCIELQFTAALLPGQLDSIGVWELIDNGLGAEVTSEFSIVDNGSGLVTLTNDGTPLENETWYGVRGVAGCPLELQFVTVFGDADGNFTTNAIDLSRIWVRRGNVASACDPNDIDGNGTINAIDVNAAWANRGPFVPAKPSGHQCSIP